LTGLFPAVRRKPVSFRLSRISGHQIEIPIVGRTVDSPHYRRLAALLRRVRLESGLTQAQVAMRLRRPQSFVSKYEAGGRRIDVVELQAICEALGRDVRDIVACWAGHKATNRAVNSRT
jgi:hypothetical protein